MSFMVEVIADSSGKWCSNTLRFGTKDEAQDYGRDLHSRWCSIRQWRVSDSPDPVTARWAGKRIVFLTEAACRARGSNISA